jgi:murein DD-endopeptidase MepM/ murein hydrolase activator NlpD
MSNFTRSLVAIALAAGLLAGAAGVADHGAPEAILPVTKGAYRLPFVNGTQVRVSGNHVTHSPHNRIDMSPTASGAHNIVAAGDGIIEYIQDSFDTTCPSVSSDNPTPCSPYNGPSGTCRSRRSQDCGGGTTTVCRNNYVWIRHANGEWTKYTHMRVNSVPNNLAVGSFVNAGTVIGVEGDVGCASGTHLHFEAGIPDFVDTSIARGAPGYDPLNIDPANCDVCGFPNIAEDNGVVVNANRQNRIPLFCGADFLGSGTTVTAEACDGACFYNGWILGGTIENNSIFWRQVTDSIGNSGNSFVVENGAGAAVRAQNGAVILTPGFRAEAGSFFVGSIGACDSPGR